MALDFSIVKYICHLLLCILELSITIWYPLCQTLHYYQINQKTKHELAEIIKKNLKHNKKYYGNNLSSLSLGDPLAARNLNSLGNGNGVN